MKEKVEIWKPIKNYENLYEASNQGRIRNANTKRILKQMISRIGYALVSLSKKSEYKSFLVHRLVAQTFLDIKSNCYEINHKDENKLNNSIDNLEYCDRQYNVDYSLSKQIDQYTKSGEFVKTWKSSADAGRNGYTQPNVIACCKGRLKTHKGFIWKYHK